MHFKYFLKEDSSIVGCRREGNIISKPLRSFFFFLPVCDSPYYWLARYFKAKTLPFAACYLIYRDLILCNVLYIYTSVINCTLDKKED